MALEELERMESSTGLELQQDWRMPIIALITFPA